MKLLTVLLLLILALTFLDFVSLPIHLRQEKESFSQDYSPLQGAPLCKVSVTMHLLMMLPFGFYWAHCKACTPFSCNNSTATRLVLLTVTSFPRLFWLAPSGAGRRKATAVLWGSDKGSPLQWPGVFPLGIGLAAASRRAHELMLPADPWGGVIHSFPCTSFCRPEHMHSLCHVYHLNLFL